MASVSLQNGMNYQEIHKNQSDKARSGVSLTSSGSAGVQAASTLAALASSPSATTSTAGHIDTSSPAASSSSGNEISLSALSPMILPSPGPMNGGPVEEVEVDSAIIQALMSPKERLYMLKLGEDMELLIKEKSATQARPQRVFNPSNPYQRMLIHRSCIYYRLHPEVDQVSKNICVSVTAESRIPSRRMYELVPETSASMPSFKIMRRNTPEGRSSNRQSSTPSVSSTGTDFPTAIVRSDSQSSDVGASSVDGSETVEDDREAVLRSLGLPSKPAKTSNGTTTPRKTMQEREAEYAEARNRIFQDFAEKEKEAAKLRADREREREVTEMHREEADADTSPNLRIPAAMAGVSRSSSPGKPRDRAPSSNLPQDTSILDASPSLDPGLVAYPSLYNADNVQDANQPTNAPLYPMDPTYDPTTGPYAPQSPPMAFSPNNPYAYPMPPNPMQMGYPPYPPLPNQPGPPHGAVPMGPPMIGMVPYPYYPPPAGWGENHGGYSLPPVQEGHPLPPGSEHGYGMYGPPPTQPQQPHYWTPAPHSQPPPDMSPPPNQYMGPPHPTAQAHYPPQMPYYNPAPPQPTYPHPPPHGQGYPPPQQYPPNFNAPQRPSANPQQGPPPLPRQVWSPNANTGRRDLPGRNPPPHNAVRHPPGRNASANGQNPLAAPWTPGPQASNGQMRPPGRRGSMLREVPESPRHSSNAASLIATPMSHSSNRSRNSSISSQRGGAWYSPRTPDGFTPMSPSGSILALAGVTASRMSIGSRQRSGSQSGSMSENISVAGEESGAITPLDETASLASSSMSSTGSTRTFTSTSSKHPSLPPRPDWSMGPMGGLYPGGLSFPNLSPHSGSNHSSVHGRSGSSSNSSQPSHSRNHSFQSQNGSPYSGLISSEFPPLPGGPAPPSQVPLRRPMAPPAPSNGVWNGGLRNTFQSSPMPPIPQGVSPLLHTTSPAISTSGIGEVSQNRFSDPDSKYSRPPAKGSGALFDHKQPGRGSAPRPSTPVRAVPISQNPSATSSFTAEDIETGLAQLNLVEDITPSMANTQQIRPAAPTPS